MEDRTHPPAHLRDTNAPPAHGITIVPVLLPAGVPLRASCLCGWQSTIVPSRPHAASVGETHLASVRRQDGETTNPDQKEHNVMPDQTQTEIQTHALPPCPWWCRSENRDHRCEYESVATDDPSNHYRYHVADFGSVAVVQPESNRLGLVTLEPVRIGVYVEGADTTSDADRLAAQMRQATDLMKRIERTDESLTVTTEGGTYVVPPCPTWCVLPSDHDLDNPVMREFDGALNRMHRAGEWTVPTNEAGETMRVEVDWTTVVGGQDEPEATDPPSVLVATTTASLDVHQARIAAAALTSAADTLAGILASSEGDER